MHDLDSFGRDAISDGNGASAPAPGRRTLTASLAPRRAPVESAPAPEPVQRREPAAPAAPMDDPFALHLGGATAIARGGLADAPAALPHLEPIQRAFGHHDVSSVPAFVGGSATGAAEQLGARAYAVGGNVAFASSPDLFTAAHEAAHVVQQRGGVQLASELGQTGDRYEQHADRVAEAVVAGQSAAAILDEMAGGGAPSSSAVQRADSMAPAPAPAATAAPTSADPAAAAAGGAHEIVLSDLGAKGKPVLIAAIGGAAPNPGTKVELKANLRVPIPDVPGLWLSGKAQITVDHTATGLQTTMAGGIGLALGGPGEFGDLLATLSLQGTGADAARSVEMLLLAFESTVRAVPDALFIAAASRMVLIALLIAYAAQHGMRPADVIADLIWGKGHAAKVIAAMKDGESAQFDAGGEVGGEAGPGGKEGSVEGAAGVVEREKIEKKPGQAPTTKDMTMLTASGKVSFPNVEGVFKLEASLTPGGPAKLEMGGTGRVTGGDLGDLSTYAGFVAAGIAAVRSNLAAVPPSPADPAKQAAQISAQLDPFGAAAASAVHASVDQLARALEQRGISKAKTNIGLEALFKLDTGAHKASLVFSLVDGGQVAIPGNEGKASYKEKTLLVDVPIALAG